MKYGSASRRAATIKLDVNVEVVERHARQNRGFVSR